MISSANPRFIYRQFLIFLTHSTCLACALFIPSSLAAQEPAVELEETVITASRTDQILGDIPAHVTLLAPQVIRQSAALTTDDLLRQVPGFSLFRRSSSLVAHPTTQGVSLRGIGASGVSRTLVLLDGMPLNDPFGGWVQWHKVRRGSLERVEVLRGGGAHLWGNYALGGVIHLQTRMPRQPEFRLVATGGDGRTGAIDLIAAERFGTTGVMLEGGYFSTDGYKVLRADQRGAIDVNADSKSSTLRLKVERPLSASGRLFAQLGIFNEERGNGTRLTQNDTDAGYAALSTVWAKPSGKWTLSGFTQVQEFRSVFSAAAADRSTERPALDQFKVPSKLGGVSVEWLKPAGRRHVLAAGSDLRWLSGETNENYRNLGDGFTRRRWAGGEQQVFGLFLQDQFRPTDRWHLTAAGRVDAWRTFDSFRRELNLETDEFLREDQFDARSRWVFNPRLAARYDALPSVSIRTAAYRTFRAPTLNELFRPFRVGNNITEANPKLVPEQLTGVELGMDYNRATLTAHVTAYWNQIDDAIFNRTIEGSGGVVDPCGFVPDEGSCRQRENLQQVRVVGLEADTQYRLPWHVSTGLGYLFTQSEFAKGPAEVQDKRLPQIPKHQVVLTLGYDHPKRVQGRLQLRYVGAQFEDDRNTLELGDFAVVDLNLSKMLGPHWEVFLQAENLLDKTYLVGRSGSGPVKLVNVGMPRRLHGGVRVTR